MPKRYKLLKDLPGYPKGTVFTSAGLLLGWPVMVADQVQGKSSAVALYPEDHPDWFAPLSDDPPYPWEPEKNDKYWMTDAVFGGVIDTKNHGEDSDEAVRTVGHVYRTQEDAELRLKAEPLVNAAVKALLNRKTNAAARHCHVLWNSHLRDFFVGTNCDSSPCVGVLVNSKHDAQAIAALFNFFIAPPHG